MEILYQDKALAVVVKPVGLESQAEVPGELEKQLGGMFYPVHRLDQNVGGVMVYARSKPAAAALSRTIQEGTMVKEYVAMVHGQRLTEGETSLVQIRLHTGRSHQIRVQFASRGYPLVGDHKYGSKDNANAPMLFSCRITFPWKGETKQFEAYPPWMKTGETEENANG